MLPYVTRRILLLIPSLLAVYTITFFLMHATPGGPWDRTGRPLPANVVANLNAKYGLSDPIWEQYLKFLGGIVTRGDLGQSYIQTGQDVRTMIATYFPISFQLGLAAMTLAVLAGLALGMLGAVRHNTWVDYVATFLSVVGISTPNYVVATLLVLVFAVSLGWLPTGGWSGILTPEAIIPVAALALQPMALIARYTRASMLTVRQQDYMRTAQAKGLRSRRVLWRHGLPNALIAVITVAGVAFAEVVTGSFFVETINNVPGIGRYFVNSVLGRDYPVIMGTTLLFGSLIMIANLVVDILYVFLDPRLRYD